jgi:hypothetical protein
MVLEILLAIVALLVTGVPICPLEDGIEDRIACGNEDCFNGCNVGLSKSAGKSHAMYGTSVKITFGETVGLSPTPPNIIVSSSFSRNQ